MIFIPGFIITLATFPGVIVHEAAHQLMCRFTGTPVLKVCYFQTGNPAGYVIHDEPSSGWKHFVISVAPFLLNSIVGLLICLPVALAHEGMSIVNLLLGWVGFSVAMHAFPSTGDANSLWAAIRKPTASWLLRIIAFPVVFVIHIGAVLSVVWFDAIYAAIICFGAPAAFLEMIA